MSFSGNEKADITAKEALKLNISECQIPFCDVKHVINSYINDMWQIEWDKCHEISYMKQILV